MDAIHKQLETHGYVLNTVTSDALVLKHQTISVHSADQISVELDQFQKIYYIYWWDLILHLKWTTLEYEIKFWKQNYPVI